MDNDFGVIEADSKSDPNEEVFNQKLKNNENQKNNT
jgi:hypothetical protein